METEKGFYLIQGRGSNEANKIVVYAKYGNLIDHLIS